MKWKEGGQFENPSPGSHVARCFQLIDLGTQTHSWQGETWQARDVRITFELPFELMTGKYNANHKGKPFASSLTMKQSLHSAAKLRSFLESWRGRKFTKEELTAYDPRKIVGAACRLTLIADGDRVFIDSIAPLGKGEVCPSPVNPPLFFSLDPEEFDQQTFAKLSEKTQEKIKVTPEFARAVNPQPDPEPTEYTPQADNGDSEVPF
jgi:hypothetical protein